MKMIAACILLLLVTPAFAAGQSGKDKPVSCTAGPVTKIFGGTSWLVYGCADGRSVLVVSDRDSADLKYIMLSPTRSGVHVVSEGWGEGPGGNAAFATFKAMSAKDLGALVAEARRADH